MSRIAWPILGLGALAAALVGCQSWQGPFSSAAEKSVESVAAAAAESRTLAELSEIQEALREYYAHERKIPDTLSILVPQYLAEIPTVELGLRAHHNTNRVTVYGPEVLVDGVIDGAKIKDTGGWGYVHNDRQIVVFVDCTHLSSNGAPWYSRQP